MKVKPNLFLNMSPQTTEEGGLAFARNMKLDDDGNLVSDYGYKNITAMADYNIVGHIVGLDNKIYFFCHTNNVSKIVEYDEVTETATPLTTAWTYNGGEIDGYVNTNQSGEKILTIGEYLSNGSNIPLKHINLSYSNVADESLYCQAPKVPTTNLVLKGTYPKAIPNGTYVFFIRYKIRKDVYTNWFLCSCPIFAGTSEKITTLQGGLKYINIHRDSAKSFKFQVTFSQVANKNSYEEFQLGFIITHDEATDARIWKSFKLSSFVNSPTDSQNLIYFDYDNIQETNIDDLLETTYELYNVRNVTSFKNKLYISNYKETNFNSSELSTLGSKISVGVSHSSQQGSSDVAPREIRWGGYKLNYNNTLGYYDTVGATERYTISYFIGHRQDLNLLVFGFGDFSKGDLKEKEDILHFDLKWDSNYDPDLMTIHNMVNNIYNKAIFGNDFDLSYDGGRIGLVEIDGSYNQGFWRFAVSNSPHPWYSKGLTFCYGSINDDDLVYLEYAKNHVVPLNVNTGQAYGNYSKTWVSRDVGFTDASYNFLRSNTEKEIKQFNRFFYGYCYLTSGTNVYNLDLNDNFKNDNYVENANSTNYPFEAAGNINYDNIKSEIQTKLFNLVVNTVVGVDENNVLILSLTNASTGVQEEVKLNALSVVFRSCEFKVESPEDIGTNDDDNHNVRFYVTLKSYDYTSIVTVGITSKNIHYVDTLSSYTQGSTLMPLSTYNVYAHFVDNHNIISNGVKIATLSTGANYNNVDILSLNYSISNLPTTNYKSFFLSISNVGNIIIECFGYQIYNYNGSKLHIVQCLEADALLYNINDNIKIIAVDSSGNSQTVPQNAKYYTSGHSVPIIAFGNCGFIGWTTSQISTDNWSDFKLYVSISKSTSNEANNKLVKATPYIPLANTSGTVNIANGFYNSYFCLVKKPSFDLASSAYCVGNDVYSAGRTNGLTLKDFDYYIQQQDSSTYCIRSNFNLNYLSLTEDVNDKLFSVGKASSGVKQVAKVLNSSILSFIYELKSMYKDFMNKTFREYDSNYKIDFDNTIRVSHVLSDETFNNSIFKFAAVDYYNVPTDRGIIVNLFSIGNNIFVHTKSSFYKFDGNQTIVSNNSDIQLQESEPFDNGVTQIFDSEYGYGGIDTKQSGCITFDSYFFYDKSSNHIFAYGGNSQVQLIDGNIYKLLAYYKPKDCKTVHDELNCRVLFEFTSSRSEHANATYKTFTLSYNYKTKTFVSFHDLSLVNAFAGRHRTYSYNSALVRLFEAETTINTTVLASGMNVNQIFGEATTACIIEFGSQIYKKQASPFGIAVVLLPQTNIKEVVDSVKYVADVQQTDPETQSTPIYDVLVNPQVTRNNPVVNFYIVTDSCVSSLVNTNVNDNARPNTLLDYKGFKYDMGFWTSNFFRNNINKTNIYDYPQKYPNRALDADNNSLVYGRYFIFVFDFKVDTPIKFEEIFMNSDKY